MTMVGADTAELRSLAEYFELSADRLKADATALNVALEGTNWSGRDATDFREDWTRNISPSLRSVRALLRDSSKELIVQANQQNWASNSNGGVSGGPRAPGGTNITEPDQHRNDEKFDTREYSNVVVFGGESGDEISPSDIAQGAVGDCTFMASLAALAATEEGRTRIRDMITDNGDGTFTVEFGDGERVTVDDEFYLNRDGNRSMYGDTRGDLWVPIIEEAYAQKHGGYDAINGGNEGRALTELGFPTTNQHVADLSVKELTAIVTSGAPVVISATLHSETGGFTMDNDGTGNHAFSVVGTNVDAGGQTWVTVRNPWSHNRGVNLPPGVISGDDGTLRMTVETAHEIFHTVATPD